MPHSFLSGCGELGRLIAAFDWSATSLGPIHSWKPSQKAVVSLILRSQVPIVTLWGPEGVMIYNDAYSVFSGGRHPGLLGSDVREGWPEVADFNDNVMKVGLAGGTLAYRDQELTLNRTGRPEQVWMDLDYSPILDERSVPAGVMAVVVETTAKVTAERWRASERERQRQMFEQAPSFMALLSGPDHVFELTNAAYLQLIGHRNVIGLPVREALPDIAGQGYFQLLDRVFQTGEPYVGRGLTTSLQRSPCAPAEERMVDLLYQPLRDAAGDVVGIFVEGVDITDRVHAERAWQASERQFRVFAESMPNHVWAADAAGRPDWFNSRAYAYFNAEPGSLDGDAWISVVHPDDVTVAVDRWRRAVATGEPYETEFRLRHADGSFRWHLARAVLIRDAAGAPQRWIGTNTDIEEQKRTERALRDSELRLRLSQQAAGIASLEVDIATGEVIGSEMLWSLWGLPQAERVPVGVLEDLVISDDAGVRSNDESRRAGTATPSVEYRIRRADTGEERWLARDIEFQRDADGQPTKMFGVIRDVTDAKTSEERQRMLTHELEHRIKNILATVSAIASRTLRDYTDLETAREVFGQRLQALAAAHDLLNRDHWTSAKLRDVVRAALAPFPDDRIEVDGAEAILGPRRALSLALAINELATNALKYGALSDEVGRVRVSWRKSVDATGAEQLVWTWRETGGPSVQAPSRRGFGVFLIERVLAADFDAAVRIEYAPTGVLVVMTAPWPHPAGAMQEEAS